MAELAAPQGIELRLADGAVIKADNAEEALKIAAKMYEDTKGYAKEQKTKSEELERRMAEIEARTAAANRPKPVEGQFNNDEYFKLLNDSPIKAANYLDSFRFGISDPNQVPTTFQQMQRDVSVTRQEAMAAQFMQQHAKDFPQTSEAAKSLRVQFESLISQGYPATVESLNLAYNQAINDGTIKPLETKEPEPDAQPNPTLSGAGASGITDTELQKVEAMSDKELESYLKSKNLL